MPEFKVAIPSYDRENVIGRKTLKMLNENNIKKSSITIFVANKEQKTKYENVLGDEYKIVVGVKGMVNIRNFITNYYPNGELVLCLDDDVSAIYEGEPTGRTMKKVYNLKSLAYRGFSICKKMGYALWGLNPSNNVRSLKSKNKITTSLRYIIGALFGVINDKSIKVSLNSGEDFERTIKYYKKYGGVVRFNNYTAKTTYYAEGGMDASGRTIKSEEVEKKKVVNKYPTYATTFIRPNGRTEIRLLSQTDKKDENE